MEVVDGFLVILGKSVHKARQQVLHMVAFVPSRVSCKCLNTFELIASRNPRHRRFNLISTILNPLFIMEWCVEILIVVLPLDKLRQSQLQLR